MERFWWSSKRCAAYICLGLLALLLNAQVEEAWAYSINENDLQVLCIDRTPRYPRYAPIYTYYTITEPSGFGPYIFSAATGLGEGQTKNTQRWPNIGDVVTYTAYVRNRGTTTWTGTLSVIWKVDNITAFTDSKPVHLESGAIVTFTFQWIWDGQSREIHFTLNVKDARPENNSLTINTKSVAFLTYVDNGMIEKFRANTANFPRAKTDDIFDWLNRHMARFNRMFAEARSPKRVHYGILLPLNDTDPDPAIDLISFAVFPFRYRVSDPDPRLSAYYNAADDIDYGLLHEMGHQLGLIDVYNLNVSSSQNQVSGRGYLAVACLMHGCSPFLSEFSALAMTRWQDQAHGYYGQYLYNLPQVIGLRLLGRDGQPLKGAVVKVYQLCERPGRGQVITNQVKAQGVTDENGIFILPNVPIDSRLVPPVCTGDVLRDNPFGYVAVVGTNGVLHFRVEFADEVDYCWLDITECVVAYFKGQVTKAVFDRQLALGGPLQLYPPNDMTELNAFDWSAWAEGSTVGTYVVDDTARVFVGSGSIKLVTDSGGDTVLRYPRTKAARWDLRQAVMLRFSVYAENPNIGFQNGSPWIRLIDTNGNYYQYQYYVAGEPYDLLNEAKNAWRTYDVPLYASETQTDGWRRTAFGNPDMSRIRAIEFHADTWDYGFTLWLDGVCIFFASPEFFQTDFSSIEGWTKSGLWHIRSEACFRCDRVVGSFAFYSQPQGCTYEVLDRRGRSVRTTGTLTSPTIPIPRNTRIAIQFDFFREVERNARATLDRTSVQIRLGRSGRRISWGRWQTIWARSSRDLSPECGTATYVLDSRNNDLLQIRFVFDSVNGQNNKFPGWAVDNLVVKPATATKPATLEVADLGQGWDVADEEPLELKVVNIPNPVRDLSTTVFTVFGVEAEAIRVEVYDLTGRLVWRGEAEGNELPWHTEDLSGLPLANGVYLYIAYVKVGEDWVTTPVQKLVILR